MPEEVPDFTALLDLLVDHDVEFIVVGGVCAVLLGAPVTTFDLDIVHSRNESNIAKLQNALNSVNARYREHLPKLVSPDANSLATPGHHLLATDLGPLDVLGTIGSNEDYSALSSHTESITLDSQKPIRILDLDKLIEVKQMTGREKDFAMLAILKALQQEFD